MCGIFGVSGTTRNAKKEVAQGLTRLDYRGYDSWGIAVLDGKQIKMQKRVGKIADAQISLPKSLVAIGHTRWATHGAVTKPNAHPHAASDGSFVLAQNGIFENYIMHKQHLHKDGYTFVSDTDTEVIVRLIEKEKKHSPRIEEAVSRAFGKLQGRNTIIVLTQEGTIVACRN